MARPGGSMSGVKEEAMRLIDGLPEEISWDDIIYQIYVKKKIERGIKAAEEGRMVAHDEIKKRLLAK
jgi:hypothetical protein